MSPTRWLSSVIAVSLWMSAAMAQATQPVHPVATVAGWIETVTFPEYGIVLDAKLDTGADSSSLGVTGLDRFKRNGKIWYRFTLTGNGGKSVTIEQQTKRLARIGRAEVGQVVRPIVRLKVCVAGHVAETDFSLTDRTGRSTDVLIGRRFLATRILVDSGRTHLFPNACHEGK